MNDNTNSNEFLTPQGVAELRGAHITTVYLAMRSGALPSQGPPGQRRIARADALSWETHRKGKQHREKPVTVPARNLNLHPDP